MPSVLCATETHSRHKTMNNQKYQIQLPFIKDATNRICLSANDAGQKGKQHSYLGLHCKNVDPVLKAVYTKLGIEKAGHLHH